MRLRVLIVEDSEDDAKLLMRILTKQGFEVSAQRVDTQEAMRAALDGGVWDVILCDYTMPEFDALAALETLKRSGLDLPFVIVSGTIGEDVAVEAMRAGAHDYLMKDKLMRLAPAIRRELQEATVRRERRQADEALRLAYAELERRVEERTAELARANEELRLHQQREIATLKDLDRQKDEFLSVAAHELKTPITSLRGYAQVLVRQLDRSGELDPARVRQAMVQIDRQSARLVSLVNQLLDLSRLEAGKLMLERQVDDVASLVEGVVATARRVHPQREFLLELPGQLMAEVDPLRLEQVVTNLLDNAAKFSPKDTPIEVKVGREDEGGVRIAVRDHGPGIPPEDCARVFERFYQAHAPKWHGGMGLGLFISKEIVELHGGSIGVQCPAEGGARFTIVLPRGDGKGGTREA